MQLSIVYCYCKGIAIGMSKKKNLNVLSLFDGIGCSRLALNKCNNIKINKYFYSEIDKNCIKTHCQPILNALHNLGCKIDKFEEI